MPVEASWLSAAVAIYFLMICVQAVISNLENNPAAMLGARDSLNPDGRFSARAKRANANMVEALLLFAPLMLLVIMLDRGNEMTALGGMLFCAGRAAYAPLYWLGVPYLRTLAWLAGVVGVVLIFLQVLPFTGAA
jgi:uncharacterized MAPEG superfamily protein